MNSRSLCKGTKRASVRMVGQNGGLHNTNPKVQTSCGAKKRQKRQSGARKGG